MFNCLFGPVIYCVDIDCCRFDFGGCIRCWVLWDVYCWVCCVMGCDWFSLLGLATVFVIVNVSSLVVRLFGLRFAVGVLLWCFVFRL